MATATYNFDEFFLRRFCRNILGFLFCASGVIILIIYPKSGDDLSLGAILSSTTLKAGIAMTLFGIFLLAFLRLFPPTTAAVAHAALYHQNTLTPSILIRDLILSPAVAMKTLRKLEKKGVAVKRTETAEDGSQNVYWQVL